MENHIRTAADILKNGGVILYPTDTIWGIGCDATNPDAVAMVYKLKQREDSKSMLVLIENPNQLSIYLDQVPEIAWDLVELANKPLTIIYPKAKNLAQNLIAADGSIGIRVVKHTFCKKLLQTFRRPIVSTSANISGDSFPKNFMEIDKRIVNGVDYVVPIEFDENAYAIPSGIIKLGIGGEVKIIREIG